MAAVAQYTGLPLSTVGRELRRIGQGRLPSVDGPRCLARYERDRPGELVHLDVKKLGRIQRVGHRIHGGRRGKARGQGWKYVHVAIDDHTRLTYAEVLADETAATALGFLTCAVAWYAALGINVERVLTDNGKAERFIRTLLGEWGYARAYGRSDWRTRALPHYLSFYNTERRHGALGDTPPAARLAHFLSTTC